MANRLAPIAVAAFAACSLTSPSPVQAQDTIYVNHEGDDRVGKNLAFAIRERLRGSNLVQLSQEKQGAVYTLQVVTLAMPDSDVSTTYSVALTVDSGATFAYFMTNYVGYCGADRLTSCAENIYSYAGRAIEREQETRLTRQLLDTVRRDARAAAASPKKAAPPPR